MIQVKVGDATAPEPMSRGVILCHIVNCKGVWGGGFVLALNEMSPIPKAAYMAWKEQSKGDIPLGDTQFVETKPAKFVANLCAQKSVDRSEGVLIDYPAFRKCIRTVFIRAMRLGCDVHMPYGIGCGLAGGDMNTVQGIIKTELDVVNNNNYATFFKNAGRQLEISVTLWDFHDKNSKSYVPQTAIDKMK